jgi:hypothetical protein
MLTEVQSLSGFPVVLAYSPLPSSPTYSYELVVHVPDHGNFIINIYIVSYIVYDVKCFDRGLRVKSG